MSAEAASEFTWFFRAEYPAVVRTAYLVTHDREAAADIAQEAFTKLLVRWKRISKYDRPDAWVRRVAIRLAVRWARRERLQHAPTTEDSSAGIPGADLDLLRAVRSLPGSQRAAVVLFYYEDRPVAEVAEILDCSTSTAKVHLHRARKRLAELLGEAVLDVP